MESGDNKNNTADANMVVFEAHVETERTRFEIEGSDKNDAFELLYCKFPAHDALLHFSLLCVHLNIHLIYALYTFLETQSVEH